MVATLQILAVLKEFAVNFTHEVVVVIERKEEAFPSDFTILRPKSASALLLYAIRKQRGGNRRSASVNTDLFGLRAVWSHPWVI